MVTFATKHNGGRSQINLNFGQFSGDFPFLNCLKNSSDPANGSNGKIDPNLVDDNGYGNGTPVSRLFWVPLTSDRPGDYVCKWSNSGSVTGSAWAAGVAA